MEIQNNCCPNCGKLLELKQINFETAVFICLDTKCPYPVHGECIVVKRNIKDINKSVDLREQFNKQQNIDQLNSCSNKNNGNTESDFMLDLENLLKSQERTHVIDSTSNLYQSSHSKSIPEFDTSHQNGQSLEIPELDDFIADLLR